MNIILSGYGKMGRLIERRAFEKGHKVTAVIDPAAEKSVSEQGAGVFKTINDFEKEQNALDCVALDFSRPDAAEQNIRNFAERRIPVVVGTTGWYSKLGELGSLVEKNKSSMLWASNFSIGVNLFYRIAAYCAAMFDPYSEYDVGAYEIHHNQKADSPSGTAKTLAGIVLKNMKRKEQVVWDKLDRPPNSGDIHFASLRVGAEPGTHGLIFDSPADNIEIKHTARNREGLVYGAIIAAEWLEKNTRAGRHGIFTIDDIFG
jgi:4-hydroxy-tetrahydrodipicolinate reductase